MTVTKVGVIGGGQLGRMLALKGAELGYEVHIFSEHPSDPAAQVTRYWHQGIVGESDANIAALTDFFKKVDVVTFESEFISPEPVKRASAQSQTPVRPSIDLMAQLRERGSQKALLNRFKVPTAETFEFSDEEALSEHFRDGKKPLVAKKRLFGYDGYGTFLLRTSTELRNFLKDHKDSLAQFIFEPLVSFKRELAISLVRDCGGNTIFFPLVEWKARDKKCHWVKGPAKHKDLTRLKKALKNFVQKVDYCGLITFELFDVRGRLLVNEVAPRVHNSAHYSLNALTRDQFQAHLLGITTDKLKTDPQPLSGGFAMANLVGTSSAEPILPLDTAAFLHWYGKIQNRPGRKMGHLNTLSKNADEALRCVLREEKRFKL